MFGGWRPRTGTPVNMQGNTRVRPYSPPRVPCLLAGVSLISRNKPTIHISFRRDEVELRCGEALG